MKRLFFLIICIFSVCFSLSGCGKRESATDPALYGAWEEENFNTGYVFNEDGTGEDTFWELTFTYAADGSFLTLVYDDESIGSQEYTYSVSDGVLTMQSTDDGAASFEYYYISQ